MIKKPFQASDILTMKTVLGPQASPASLLAWGKLHESQKPNVTFWVDGVPVASGGFYIMWNGVAESWVALNEVVPMREVVEVKRQFLDWIEEYQLWRVAAQVISTFRKGIRFVEWLGMEYEGTMRSFGPAREDYLLYARVKWPTR